MDERTLDNGNMGGGMVVDGRISRTVIALSVHTWTINVTELVATSGMMGAFMMVSSSMTSEVVKERTRGLMVPCIEENSVMAYDMGKVHTPSPTGPCTLENGSSESNMASGS